MQLLHPMNLQAPTTVLWAIPVHSGVTPKNSWVHGVSGKP